MFYPLKVTSFTQGLLSNPMQSFDHNCMSKSVAALLIYFISVQSDLISIELVYQRNISIAHHCSYMGNITGILKKVNYHHPRHHHRQRHVLVKLVRLHCFQMLRSTACTKCKTIKSFAPTECAICLNEIQLWPLAMVRLLNKPYVNEVTLRGQKPPLKCCQPLEF